MAEEVEKSSGWSEEDEDASTRRIYCEEHKRSLRDFDVKMDSLVAKALDIESEFRADFDQETRLVGERRRRFGAELARLREASGDAWQDLKKGVEDSWDELEEAFGDLRAAVRTAAERFREKPER